MMLCYSQWRPNTTDIQTETDKICDRETWHLDADQPTIRDAAGRLTARVNKTQQTTETAGRLSANLLRYDLAGLAAVARLASRLVG